MKRVFGVSLVELLVAMAIGLVLLLGLTSVFIPVRQTFATRQSMGELQNSQRLAMAFISIALRNAGAIADPINNSQAGIMPVASSSLTTSANVPVGFVAGQMLLGGKASGGGDGLSVRFQADTTSVNQGCTPQLRPGDVYVDTFSVSSGYLVCTETDTTVTPQTVVSQNLVGTVQAMNILYGVDTTGGDSVTQYMTADNVTAAAKWSSVKTVQVTLVFTNPLVNQPGQSGSPTVSLIRTIPVMVSL